MTEGKPAPVFGVTGWKNSGKTTMVERLVAELTGRGHRVSTVKHAHHTVDIDHKGRDSHRHRIAGAVEVALIGGERWAIMHELRGAEEPSLADILARLSPCDLVIVEGYKREPHPKLEVRRREAVRHDRLSAIDPAVVAIAADHPVEGESVPAFPLDEIGRIADFIEATVMTGGTGLAGRAGEAGSADTTDGADA
ncbi:molybdopterin-guanine dinucleotide biosynthesis protein B [Prosthecodimorpha staleyi]|uniref:Molybdopterin-guanine dinucleotide biosynthesis protein B n=1 Tax=Prosthecodimorpha staleyi TaxID=2840188 RepID=A0A947GAE6_9HYPH|nr:molybdopterin-guanine dinucleotide biosynthesis protein B [Prosthecodimorpha staleyi]MBT9289038.1 molybdopterin-guanine dinucleotide biosynthesis protein B [Prosthecodimorpha staleyi]